MFAATLDTELTIRMSWIAVRLFNAPPKLVGGIEEETMQQVIYSLSTKLQVNLCFHATFVQILTRNCNHRTQAILRHFQTAC